MRSAAIRSLSLFVAVLGGCAAFDPEVAAPESAPVASASATAAEEEGRRALAEAGEDPTAALEAAVAAFEQARIAGGKDEDAQRAVLFELAAARFGLAAALEEGADDGKRRIEVLDGVKNACFEALRLRPAFRAATQDGRPIDDAVLAVVPKEDVRFLLLMAASWGRAAELRGLFAMMGAQPRLLALARRAMELDPSCRYGGPDRFFGAYYAKLPAIAGRDYDKSREHFERAIKLAPDFLENRALFAECWAIGSGDLDRARAELRRVIDTPVAPTDPARIDQLLSKRRARRLLESLGP